LQATAQLAIAHIVVSILTLPLLMMQSAAAAAGDRFDRNYRPIGLADRPDDWLLRAATVN